MKIRLARGGPLDDARDLRETDHGIDGAKLHRLLRHPVDDAGGLVLSERQGARLMHLQHPASPIVAHPGHDNTNRIRSGRLCGRAKQHIDRRAMATDQGSPLDLDPILGAAAPQQQMIGPRRDQGETGDDAIAVTSLSDLDLAQLIQSRRKGRRELSRHVLNDDDPRRGARQSRQQIFQRLGSAGRGPDGDHPVGGRGQRLESALTHRATHQRAGRCGRARDPLETRIARGLDGVTEQRPRLLQELTQADLRLGDDVDSTRTHRLHGDLRALLREGGADDHGGRPLLHQLAQKGDPIHARHLDIQHDDVRPLLLHLPLGEDGIARSSDDLDAADTAQLIGEHLTHDRRIVDDQNLDLSHRSNVPQ